MENRRVFLLKNPLLKNCGERLSCDSRIVSRWCTFAPASAKANNQIETDSVKHLASDCKIAQCNRIRTIAINRLKKKSFDFAR